MADKYTVVDDRQGFDNDGWEGWYPEDIATFDNLEDARKLVKTLHGLPDIYLNDNYLE